MSDKIKLREIGARISEHLKRFEADPATNIDRSGRGLKTYWNAGAGASGRYVYVTYVNYQGASHLTREEALLYLARLDAGNVGTHWRVLDGVSREARGRR